MAYNVSHCCCLHFPIVALSFLMQLQLCKWRIAGCARKFQISHQREVAHSHCLRFVQLAAGACRHKLGRYWSHHMQARQNFYVSINGGTLVTLNGGLLGVQNVDSILCPSRIGWATTLKSEVAHSKSLQVGYILLRTWEMKHVLNLQACSQFWHTTPNNKHVLANTIIGLVAHLLNYREDCLAFWLIIPPLLIVPSLACSVTSLSLCPEP